ncbi:piggyBac transposable element-derived protein 3 [Fundulus heteroclitus]|uniref:piggyBac transposable element-derived protein 3 n=1 Tax=Fundulus heteroclitus TaxID=8078 RepID=UPI00165A52BF|nr:piggyBac transposable element-derived protein 3 [Fundulus heteroclitus]
MPAARRDPRYSVQDIIAIVQDGESDVDVPFDDTDASDEESDNDPRVDKGNQEPSDSPANVDIEPRENESTMPRDRYPRQNNDFITPNTDFSGPPGTDDVTFLLTPLQYFQKFVSENMIQALATSTNEYSVQKDGRSVNTDSKEIQKMLGMYLRMGLVQMAASRMYWETDTRHPPVADVMPRSRFQSLLAKLHFVNNLTASEIEKRDKLWKLRPWLESFREKCLQVVPEEHSSVAEMAIPVKGEFISIKQHMRGKPHPWGFKVWVRAGISGMMLDFDVYRGSKNAIRVKSELGLSGDAVATCNRYVRGVDLLASFAAKYKFALKSRRWYMYIFWHTITLAVVNAWLLYKRHCQALAMPKKETLNMRKFQAQLASSLILMDSTLTTPRRGRPSSGTGSPDAAESPLTAGKRPSSDDGSPNSPSKKSCAHPPLDVRMDLTGHFPMKVKRGRCRHCSKGYTNTQCSKCDVRLCFSEDRNCFWDYHCE